MQLNYQTKTKAMVSYSSNLEIDSLENSNFRKVLYTSKNMQLVLMCLKAGEDIGEEIHQENDQFFRFERGNGKCIVNGKEIMVKSGDVIIIPAGTKHNIINIDPAVDLKMYTIYSPPHHKDQTIHTTKAEAEKEEADKAGLEYVGITSDRLNKY